LSLISFYLSTKLFTSYPEILDILFVELPFLNESTPRLIDSGIFEFVDSCENNKLSLE